MAELYYREIWVTEVTPEMTPDWHAWVLTVRWRGQGDEWVIVRHSIDYMDADGDMSWKNFEDEEWEKAHVFTRTEALAIASKHAIEVSVNGWTAQAVIDRYKAELAAAK